MLLAGDVANAAAVRGIRLRISFTTTKRTSTPHWQFGDGLTKETLLDYWPSSGTWWARRTGERGETRDAWQALELASKLAGCPLPARTA